jgi:GrpB-like predicted nucleotidyltransferase (UPF0157 family)
MSSNAPLGLNRSEVVVVPYDARWPSLFEEARAELKSVLGPRVLGIHHVGSTSVVGLCAKPILDLLVSVPDLDDARELVPELASLGYGFRPQEEIPDRHYFRRPPGGDLRTHHLSLAEPDSRHHKVTIAFRDALRRDPKLASSYADLKLRLAERFPHDRPAYIEGKSDFVHEVLAAEGLGAELRAP